MFSLMVILALGSFLVIFIKHNLNAKRFDRIFESLKPAGKFSLLWGAFIFLLLLFLGESIASTFTNDPKVIEITENYFYIIGLSYGLQGLVM